MQPSLDRFLFYQSITDLFYVRHKWIVFFFFFSAMVNEHRNTPLGLLLYFLKSLNEREESLIFKLRIL